jgi:dihydrofolate reductase
MSKLFFAVGLSLDGFIAGENRSPKNPIGDGGLTIHQWMFRQKAFREPQGMKGGEEGPDNSLLEKLNSRVGAFIMGKRMFEEGEPNWPEDLYKAPVYVLTHEKREPWVQKGSTTFYFINEGLKKPWT